MVDYFHQEQNFVLIEVLKLLQENYLDTVKLIYIDPPYNTGKEFVYPDKFSQTTSEYMLRSGQYNEDGNRLSANMESNGRFHTDWLNMMYPRLKIARNLLAKDGVIFISIDQNEVENLKKICCELFGSINFVGETKCCSTLSLLLYRGRFLQLLFLSFQFQKASS